MGAVVLVGLGPGDSPRLTEGARTALSSRLVYLRTDRHPAVAGLPELAGQASLESRLHSAADVAATVDAFLTEILDTARSREVAYAVPGNPLVCDATVRRLREMAAGSGVLVEAVANRSVVDLACDALGGLGTGVGLQVFDLLDLALAAERAPFGGGRPSLSPLAPALLLNPGPPALLRSTRLVLARLYPPATRVAVLSAATIPAWSRVDELTELSASPWPAALYVPPVDWQTSGRTADALQQIVARLRAPGGCPWDREQTHASLLQSGLEEAYEAFDALQRGDPADMAEEMGDLLLQVFLHAQIAEESDEFTLEDVYGAIAAKLVRRHPHVFADVVAASAADVLRNWDQIKRGERAARGEEPERHPLGKIPAALPALMRAQTVLRRAARAGLLDVDETRLRDALRTVVEPDGPVDAEILVDALLAVALAGSVAGLDLEEGLRSRSRDIEEAARQRAAQEEPRAGVDARAGDGARRHTEGDTPA